MQACWCYNLVQQIQIIYFIQKFNKREVNIMYLASLQIFLSEKDVNSSSS